jgi:hypothetical protein
MLRSLSVLTLAALAACNPYEPDLAAVPFTCDPEERACPEGYVAVDVSDRRCECHQEGGDDGGDDNDQVDLPDGGGGSACADDPANGAPAQATPTAIGAGATTFFAATSICATSDVDVYRVELDADHLQLTAKLQMDATVGVLSLRVVNAGGGELAVGTRSGNQVTASYTAPSPGVVMIEVASESGFADYTLDVVAK